MPGYPSKLFALVFAAFTAVMSGLTAAAMSPPSAKPPPSYSSSILNSTDAERLALGLDAAEDADWALVRFYRGQITDETARDLLLWREMTSSGGDGASFSVSSDALSRLHGWPSELTVRARAEDAIKLSGLTDSQKINWLEASGPATGEGKALLAEAYTRVGRNEDAARTIRDAWRNHTFPVSRQSGLATAYGPVLTNEDHRSRVEFLLWTGQRTPASRMISYLDSGYQKLVRARIALAGGSGGVDGLVDAVPAELQSSPGLLYDRSVWRRKRDRWEDARPLLIQINPDLIPDSGHSRIWDEKNLHLRRAIRDRDWQAGYALASRTGMTSGVDFAEAEFNAGWIALRYLGQPDLAVDHFKTLEARVGSPISLSRGAYWTAEAYTALGNVAEANGWYEKAATHYTAFYGQLAARKLGRSELTLPSSPTVSAADRSAFEAKPLTRVLMMLGENGQTSTYRRFSYHLDDKLTSAPEFVMLAELGNRYHIPDAGIRAAKAGLSEDIVTPAAAYPLFKTGFPESRSSIDRALVIALSRQETELNPAAVSGANARGIMQFLPPTAREQARREGVPYQTSWLIDDPEYTIRLGMAHLDDLVNRFDGSWVLAIAGYNAGASRPRRWVQEYGDPRTGEIDPIDWIESIPFSETRNYVQRVLENTQVYRARLAPSQSAPLRIEEDLRRDDR